MSVVVLPSKASLNFVVVGQIRSGARVVQSAIGMSGRAVCHADLFDDDDTVRRTAHEGYFGASLDAEEMPEWFIPGITNAHRYLCDRVFDNALYGESTVGARLLYRQLDGLELHDLLERRWREGDFCVIHVRRNPVSCFVSMKQAQQCGIWSRPATHNAQAEPYPRPVYINIDELIQFVRQHEASRRRMCACCGDMLEVDYGQILFDYADAMRRIFKFLELPVAPRAAGIRRLRNWEMQRRIGNWNELIGDPADRRKPTAPAELLPYLTASDLY